MDKANHRLLLTMMSMLLLTSVCFISCSKRDVMQSNPEGGIAIRAEWPGMPKAPSGNSNADSREPLRKPNEAPPEVEIIEVNIDGSNYGSTTHTFNAASNGGTVDGIPAGDDYSIFLSAMDGSNNEYYWFEENNITIKPNETTDVYVSFVHTTPYAPSNLYADWYENHILLTWMDNAYNEEHYIIERQEVGSEWYIIDSVGSENVEYHDYNFNLDSEYYYRVYAANPGGYSNHSEEIYFSTGSIAIEPPSDPYAYWHSDDSIAVTWIDNSFDETGFVIDRKEEMGTWEESYGSVGTDEVIFYDSNFNLETGYYYRIRAERDGVYSDYSTEAYVSTVSGSIDSPTDADAYWYSDVEIAISWTDNSHNETEFVIERKEDMYGVWSELSRIPADSTISIDSTFQFGREYYYRIMATNGTMYSGYSDEVTISTDVDFLRPPNNLNVFWYSSSEIAVTWDDNSTGEEQFLIKRSTNGMTWYDYDSVSADSTIYLDTNFVYGYSYYYQVLAVHGNRESGNEEQFWFDTSSLPPEQPDIQSCFFDGNKMTVRWGWTSDASSYMIYRKAIGDTAYEYVASVPATSNYHEDVNISSEDWYRYKVKAFNSNGYSDISDPDSGYVDLTGPLYFRGIIDPDGGEDQYGRMAMKSELLLVTDGRYLRVFDVSIPSSPEEADSYQHPTEAIRDVSVANDYNDQVIIVTDNKFVSLAIDEYGNVQVNSSISITGECLSVAAMEGTAFVGTSNEGLQAIDIMSPWSLYWMSNYNGITGFNDVKIYNPGNLYIMGATENDGFVIVDATDTYNMSFVNSYSLPSAAKGIFLNAQKAYLANTGSGLQVVDYNDLWTLSLYGSTTDFTDARRIWVYGNSAMIAAGTDGVIVVDKSSFASVDAYATQGACVDIIYDSINSYMYASVPGIGIYIFDYPSP